MFLNIFESIGEYFGQARETTPLDNLIPLLVGVCVGFLLCILIYLLAVLTPIKKQERKEIKLNEANDEVIKRIISNAKNQFSEESSTKSTGAKFEDLKEIAGHIISDIAKVYYPDSLHPVYELSVDEMLILNHYITDRIESIFVGPILKRVKGVKISSILNILDIKRKYEEKKLIKAANKVKLPAIWKSALAIANVVNPIYWLKKLMIDAPFVAASNKIALTIIEIIANETNKVYSKSVFSSNAADEDIEKTVQELEKMLGNEEGQ
ncbi:MAG: hypothetical protein PHO86_06755 [Bacilli bacterium]|nr:hypothetical protein [Bacilli bacterium]